MAAFISDLGESLLTKDGSLQPTADLLDGKTAVALYFSAHWCPPCRGFTPQFAEQYEKTYKDKKMEVIFVSSDKDESQFKEYYGEQPWLALPYAKRDVKDQLSKKYEVRGIPSVVILDPNGKLITKNGRAKLEEPEKFPWIPKTLSEVLAGPFVGKDGPVSAESLKDKVLGIYFSAHWCPPCKAFTPVLANVYNKLKAQSQPFEIIFASSDRDEAQFKEYFGEMPWIALPFSERTVKNDLSDLFEVQGIPMLVIVDKDHKTVINGNARGEVSRDAEGKNFPWAPPAVRDLGVDSGGIDEQKSFIAICHDLDDDDEAKLELELAALKKTAPGGCTRMHFFVAKGPSETFEQIQNLCGLTKENSKAKGVLLDIPDSGGYYVMEEDLSSASIKIFIEKCVKHEIQRHQLS